MGLGKAFVGPWDYASGSPGSKPKRLTGPQDSIKAGSRAPQRTFSSPQNTVGAVAGSKTPAKGFISPVDGYGGKVKYKSFKFGANRTQALSEE